MSRARNRADGDFGDLDISNIGAVSLDSIKGDADANTNIAFSGSDVITITTGGTTAATAGTSSTGMFANESRFNMKYTHGDVMGFIELDFFDAGTGANEIVSNSFSPRLRHAFIKYDNVLVGQTWSTFMNTSALAETLDFAGPINGGVFVRQTQVRYTNGGLQLSLENPFSDEGDATQDSVPDFIAKYTFKGDWGNVSVAGLVRELNTDGGNSETAVGYSVAGRINTMGKDSLRFQIAGGGSIFYQGGVTFLDTDNAISGIFTDNDSNDSIKV